MLTVALPLLVCKLRNAPIIAAPIGPSPGTHDASLTTLVWTAVPFFVTW